MALNNINDFPIYQNNSIMAKFIVTVNFAESDPAQLQQLNQALQKESGRKFKRISQNNSGKDSNGAKYDVETGISIADLAGFLSGISSRISKNASFTIQRHKFSAA